MMHPMGNWIAAIVLGSVAGVFLLSKCLLLISKPSVLLLHKKQPNPASQKIS